MVGSPRSAAFRPPFDCHAMDLKERLARDLKDAMRAKATVQLGTIRMLTAAITEREKREGPLSGAQQIEVAAKQAKQRRDAARQFAEADRDDLAQRELDELAVLEAYLPAQLSDAELSEVIHQVIAETGASGMQDMGKVMGAAMGRLKGRAEGGRISAVVKQHLSR